VRIIIGNNPVQAQDNNTNDVILQLWSEALNGLMAWEGEDSKEGTKAKVKGKRQLGDRET
jgi:hypothetical protein